MYPRRHSWTTRAANQRASSSQGDYPVTVPTVLDMSTCIRRDMEEMPGQYVSSKHVNVRERMYSFSLCQRFSMGLLSGDSAGDFHQLMDSAARRATAFFEVCLGSLSCMKWHTGMTSHRNGNRVCLKTSTYCSASMDPSNVHMLVAPFKLMPAHTWTFTECLSHQERNAQS